MMNSGRDANDGKKAGDFQAFFATGSKDSSCFRKILVPCRAPQETVLEQCEEIEATCPPIPPEVIAEEIIAKARRAAEHIFNEAQAVLHDAHRQAEEAANAAVREALDNARKDHEARREQFDRAARELLEQLEKQWQAAQEALEIECARLAITIAEKILHDTLEENPKALVPVVREALVQLSDSARVRVTVSAAHLKTLQIAREEFAAMLPEGVRLDIVADEDKTPGACVLYGDHGGLDVGASTQLEIVQERMEQALEQM